MVYSTRRFVLCINLCHFVLVCFSHFSIAITSLGEEGANLSAFRTFVRFVLVWICQFPIPLGVWEGLRFVIVALPGFFSYFFVIVALPGLFIYLFFELLFTTTQTYLIVFDNHSMKKHSIQHFKTCIFSELQFTYNLFTLEIIYIFIFSTFCCKGMERAVR